MARFSQVFVIIFLLLAGLAASAAAATVEEMLAEGSLGSDKAPVTVIEYASLTCPHCAAFAGTTFEAFKKKYVDSGKVHFIYRDFPFDQPGLRAAMMVRCSGPERFFGFLEILFKSQESWAGATDPLAELAKIATQMHADLVVVGASEHLGHRIVGSLASRLVRAGKWPVTVVP